MASVRFLGLSGPVTHVGVSLPFAPNDAHNQKETDVGSEGETQWQDRVTKPTAHSTNMANDRYPLLSAGSNIPERNVTRKRTTSSPYSTGCKHRKPKNKSAKVGDACKRQ